MSTLLYPVAPQQLRRGCLEAAALIVAAERAMVLPWVLVPLAPRPPGARPDDPADRAPVEVFPLGGYGSLVADLRATLDTLLLLGQAPPGELWTAEDAAAADHQLASWRGAVEQQIDSAVVAAGEVRIGALAALRHSTLAQRDIAISPPCRQFAPALGFLRQAGNELVQISRGPGGQR